MSVHEIIIWIMAVFAVLGALDRIFGGRLGIGKEFEEGILAMGSLALAMIGVITLAPVLPGFSSCKSSEMFWMDSPASRRKQIIRSRFKSSSEYSRRPPSDNALGTRMFLVS